MFLKIIFGLIGSLFLLKTYFVHRVKNCKNNVCLNGRTVLITGSNTGIGFQSALEFAKRGARVILACRDKDKAEAAREEIIRQSENDNVVIKIVNFKSLESVKDCANDILKSENKLDILVNNAGVGGLEHKTTSDGLQVLMQINYFGPFLLTMLLLDLIKKSPRARIINVSSLMAKMGEVDPKDLNKYTGKYGIYSNSKLCNILYTQKLSGLLTGTNVSVFSLHPGVVRTDIFRRIQSWRKIILDIVAFFYFKSAEEGAQTIIYTTTEQDIEKHSGKHFEECDVVPPYPSATDPKLVEDVFTATCILVNVDEENFK